MRTQAQAAVAQARDEVGRLTRHRDDITRQLSSLSGVIEALAVPENEISALSAAAIGDNGTEGEQQPPTAWSTLQGGPPAPDPTIHEEQHR